MKFLSVIAASVAALASAQQRSQTGTNAQHFPGYKQQQQQRTDGYGQQRDTSVYKQQQQKGGRKGNKGRNNKGQSGNKKKCSVAKVPQQLQTKYVHEFQALDTDHSGSLDASEFKNMGVKIADAFSAFRKNQDSKPTWQHQWGNKGGNKKPTKGNKGGNKKPQQKPTNGDNNQQRPNKGGRGGRGSRNNNADNTGNTGDNNKPQQKPTNGGTNGKQQQRPNRGGRGGRGSRNNNADNTGNTDDSWLSKLNQKYQHTRRLASEAGGDFWKYLQQQGFVHKPTQKEKDTKEAKRAARVFGRFDRDRNQKVSLCEYENAMYRTQMEEKKMSQQNKKNDGIAVVHG